jgi:hypothetical protein
MIPGDGIKARQSEAVETFTAAVLVRVPKKPVPHMMRGGHRFSGKIMHKQESASGFQFVFLGAA